MKYTAIVMLFIGLHLNVYSQEMKYIQNIHQLFSLHNQDLASYKNDNISALHDISGERLGVTMHLLPAAVSKKYFPKKVEVNFPVYKSFDAIVRLEQENQETIRLDFYSTWNERYDRDQQIPSVFEQRYQELIQIFKDEKWDFINADNYATTDHLIFNKQDLQLTIKFELDGDVQEDPLYSSINYSWPASHIPTLYRYVHFVFRKKI